MAMSEGTSPLKGCCRHSPSLEDEMCAGCGDHPVRALRGPHSVRVDGDRVNVVVSARRGCQTLGLGDKRLRGDRFILQETQK